MKMREIRSRRAPAVWVLSSDDGRFIYTAVVPLIRVNGLLSMRSIIAGERLGKGTKSGTGFVLQRLDLNSSFAKRSSTE